MSRATKYKKEYCDELIKHMGEGLSIESFAGVVGVCKQTLYTWFDAHEDFMQAKEIGTSKSLLWWEQQGVKGLFTRSFRDSEGNSESISINSTMWTFNMNNRFGWSKKEEIKHSGEVARKVEVTKVDLDERVKQLKAENKSKS